jgi:serine/threonine protein kinase
MAYAMRSLQQVYTVGRRLGSGAFSVVHTCVHKKTGAEFAVKIVDRYDKLLHKRSDCIGMPAM